MTPHFVCCTLIWVLFYICVSHQKHFCLIFVMVPIQRFFFFFSVYFVSFLDYATQYFHLPNIIYPQIHLINAIQFIWRVLKWTHFKKNIFTLLSTEINWFHLQSLSVNEIGIFPEPFRFTVIVTGAIYHITMYKTSKFICIALRNT